MKIMMNSYLQVDNQVGIWGAHNCSPVVSPSLSGNTVFRCICSSTHIDVPQNHSVVLLLTVFLPKFYYGNLGTHPASVNENLFMQPSFSIAYQQLNAVFPVPHPNVSIYNINKLFLSSSQHCGGVYICVGHLSNSSQWAFTSG